MTTNARTAASGPSEAEESPKRPINGSSDGRARVCTAEQGLTRSPDTGRRADGTGGTGTHAEPRAWQRARRRAHETPGLPSFAQPEMRGSPGLTGLGSVRPPRRGNGWLPPPTAVAPPVPLLHPGSGLTSRTEEPCAAALRSSPEQRRHSQPTGAGTSGHSRTPASVATPPAEDPVLVHRLTGMQPKHTVFAL